MPIDVINADIQGEDLQINEGRDFSKLSDKKNLY